MKTRIILAFFLILSPFELHAQQVLTLEQCREKPYQRETHHTDADIGRLDGGIEKHPMQTEQHAHTAHLE